MSESKIQAPLERKLHKELSKAQQVRDLLAGLTNGDPDEEGVVRQEIDPQLLADMVEGETDLYEVVRELHLRSIELAGFAEGTAAVIREFQERKSRLDKSVETIRGLIKLAMLKIDTKTLRTDIATFSVGKPRPKLEVMDETEIPSKYFEEQAPRLNTRALLADLVDLKKKRDEVAAALHEHEAINEEAFSIPGTKLLAGEPPLTVRVK